MTSLPSLSDAERLAIAVRALRWYADKRHWQEDDWNIQSVVTGYDYGNPGGKARRALKRIGEVVPDV